MRTGNLGSMRSTFLWLYLAGVLAILVHLVFFDDTFYNWWIWMLSWSRS
jgi:hypothetical protein